MSSDFIVGLSCFFRRCFLCRPGLYGPFEFPMNCPHDSLASSVFISSVRLVTAQIYYTRNLLLQLLLVLLLPPPPPLLLLIIIIIIIIYMHMPPDLKYMTDAN